MENRSKNKAMASQINGKSLERKRWLQKSMENRWKIKRWLEKSTEKQSKIKAMASKSIENCWKMKAIASKIDGKSVEN